MDFIAMAETLEVQAAALRRHAGTLPAPPPPAPEPNPWNDWLGGDAPPAEARGKLVDIQLEGSEIIAVGVLADVFDWTHADEATVAVGEVKRWRLADEQPSEA